MWTGNVSPVIRQKAKGTRPKRNAERRAARRATLPGFPVDPRPFTLDEVRAYLSGDRLTCLRCGKAYRSLGVHLLRIHGVGGEEYRAMYGLPWSKGLAGEATSQKISAHVLKRIDDGWAPSDASARARLVKGHANQRPRQPFRRELCLQNVAHRQPAQGWSIGESIRKFLERVAQGRTPKEVFEDSDLPGRTWFNRNMNAAHKAIMLSFIHAQPYEYQARAQFGFSKRFYQDVRAMRKAGMSDHRIADELGVTAMTVNRHRAKHGIA